MTNGFDRAKLEGELRALLSPDFSRVSVGDREDENGMRPIFLLPHRLFTREEIVAVCKSVAPIIRGRIPERPDRWTAAIIIQRISWEVMGVYYLGWTNHPEESEFFDVQTDHADWLSLYQRLRALLSAHGVEKPEGEDRGDFSLREDDDGLPRLRLAVHEIEFLTPQLIAEIQALLRDGYSDWRVSVRLILSPAEKVPADGIVIQAGEIVEHWDRTRLRRRLGERFKV